MTSTYWDGTQEHKVNIELLNADSREHGHDQSSEIYCVTVDGIAYEVAAQNGPEGALYFDIDGRRVCAFVASDGVPSTTVSPARSVDDANVSGVKTNVWIDGDSWEFAQVDGSADRRRRHRSSETVLSGSLTTSMPGQVLEVHVAEGDLVEAGAPMVTLEAMKMQSRLTAPQAGRVEKLHCQAGDVVTRGQLLVEIG